LQAGEAEQHIGEVAENRDHHRLGEAQPEGHQHDAVDEVLDLEAGAGPHAEQIARLGPALGFRDEVGSVRLDSKRSAYVEGLLLVECHLISSNVDRTRDQRADT
jgi:hypothetical protein